LEAACHSYGTIKWLQAGLSKINEFFPVEKLKYFPWKCEILLTHREICCAMNKNHPGIPAGIPGFLNIFAENISLAKPISRATRCISLRDVHILIRITPVVMLFDS